MAIIVIGGQSRNIGKTGVVCALISALPERCWTAIKISQHAHDEPGDCDTEAEDRAMVITEERDSTGGTDSSRYLAAGAERSFWVRTAPGQLGNAMPRIRAVIAGAQDVIIESNSVLRFLDPDVYASVLDPAVGDFKASARSYLDRADAVLLPAGPFEPARWTDASLKLLERIPYFRIAPPLYYSPDFASFVTQKLQRATK